MTSSAHVSLAPLAARLRYFSAAELSRLAPVPAAYESRAAATLELVDELRHLLRAPVTITSLYRSPEHNRRIGGSPTSQHMTADAADFIVGGGLPHAEIARRLLEAESAGRLPGYSQLIFYPWTTGHLHVGRGTKREKLYVLPGSPKQYRRLASAAQLGRTSSEAARERTGRALSSELLALAVIVGGAALTLF